MLHLGVNPEEIITISETFKEEVNAPVFPKSENKVRAAGSTLL